MLIGPYKWFRRDYRRIDRRNGRRKTSGTRQNSPADDLWSLLRRHGYHHGTEGEIYAGGSAGDGTRRLPRRTAASGKTHRQRGGINARVD